MIEIQPDPNGPTWTVLDSPFPIPSNAKANPKGNMLWRSPDGQPLWVPQECIQNGLIMCEPRVCSSCMAASLAAAEDDGRTPQERLRDALIEKMQTPPPAPIPTQRPSWLVPVIIGGGLLLLLLNQKPTKPSEP